jgi:hypothetical protein
MNLREPMNVKELMDVRELITMAERCRRLGMACNDEVLAGQFRALGHEYLDRARQLGTHPVPRRYHRQQRQSAGGRG